MKTINISTDFSDCPGPRYHNQGDFTGEDFYHQLLNEKFMECVRDDDDLTVNLDDTNGYMSSFLDEAFGNLVYDFGPDEVTKRLKIVSNEEPVWIDLIFKKIIPDWTKNLNNKIAPKKTLKKNHTPWYRIINGELKQGVWVKSV